MENEARIKTLNILFTAAWISIIITTVLTLIITFIKPGTGMIAVIIGPVITYAVGRILCNKEYTDEAS